MACVVFLWDFILTFGMEVDFVWKSKWNFMKGLYLFQRYLPFTEAIWLPLYRESDVSPIFLCSFYFEVKRGEVWGRLGVRQCSTLMEVGKIDPPYIEKRLDNLLCVQYLWSLGLLHLRVSSTYAPCFESY